MKKLITFMLAGLITSFFLLQSTAWSASSLLMMITPVLSSNHDGTIVPRKEPSLALMAARGTDKIEMAWVSGSDGSTPVKQIKYELHLSTAENFIPDSSTLKKIVTGANQAEISGLDPDMLYYGKVRAVYPTFDEVTNELQSKTYKNDIQLNSNATVVSAADLGLGKHTTADGITYTYTGNGTLPTTGSILFSEDVVGGMTLRTVDSASKYGNTVIVETSDASLTDAINRGTISNSFQLFDVATQGVNLPASSRITATMSFASADGSQQSQMEWKDRLLTVKQTNYAYNKEDLSVIPQDRTSLIRLKEASTAEESFTANVTAEFQPKLITEAEWGDNTFNSVHVGAKGTLSMTALAQWIFYTPNVIPKKEFKLWERTWTSVYQAGPVPVYQEITLSMNVEASASASAKINAQAETKLEETIEVGAKYDGSAWKPYINHDGTNSLTASFDVVGGKASADIRLVPKIEVKFYKVIGASLSALEPLAKSVITAEETTKNADFLSAHSNCQMCKMQLSSFNIFLGLESNIAVELTMLGREWELFSACVLGTDSSCWYPFNPKTLFSLPELTLWSGTFSENKINLFLEAIDGVHNNFNPDSVNWEVFPDDGGIITPGSCFKPDPEKEPKKTICLATFEPMVANEYTIFASGYGRDRLGEMSRQFREISITAPVVNPAITQTPMSGPAGTTFAQSGSGFTPNSTGTMHFRKPDGTEYPTAQQAMDSTGHFSINYTAPSDKPAGNYTWWVVDGPTGVSSNQVTYTITAPAVNPTIAQTPMSGTPGTTFSQWGTGFTPNSTGTMHFRKPDGTEYPTAQQSMDSTGHFSISYTAPSDKPAGNYTWWVVDGPTGVSSNQVTYTITAPAVNPTVAQTPMSGPQGTTFAQWGTGFTPNSTGTMHFRKPDGTEYPTAQQAMDSTGHFDITYTAPTSKAPGNYTWWVVDGPTGVSSNQVTYTVEVKPVIAQTPMSGPPGTTFAQWGTGFTPNSTGTMHFRKPDGTEYPTAQQAMDSIGHFDITYTAPSNKPAGNYTWWVIDGPTGKSSNQVTYTIQ